MSLDTYSPGTDMQTPFDVAVIMPTVLQPSLLQAVRSVFSQDLQGRIQLLLGIDRRVGPLEILDQIRSECPKHMAITICDPGYSTARRNGGLYNATGGGSLRTVMSHLANSPLLAYLDDDNWWAEEHLSTLAQAIKGVGWAWSYRWMVDTKDDRVIAVDKWDSVGPGRGFFRLRTGGFVDTNCLMIDRRRADDVLWLWSHGMLWRGAGSDRHVFLGLVEREPWRCTGKATVYYRVDFDRQKALARRMLEAPPEEPPKPRISLRTLMNTIHPRSPYANPAPSGELIPEPRPHAGITALVKRLKPRSIIYVSDGDTTTALRLARAAATQSPEALTVAVDTFLPRLTVALLRNATRNRKPLGMYDECFTDFRLGVLGAGLSGNLLPLAQEPLNAAQLMREAGIFVDLVGVPFCEDKNLWHAWLRAYWHVLRKGGAAFTEYNHPDHKWVSRRYEQFAQARNLKVETIGPENACLLYVVKT